MNKGAVTHWELETDVVCVGSGLAGCAAALAAADHDLEVMIVEKEAQFGGKTTWSDGGLWIPANDFAHNAGIGDSTDDGRAYLQFLAAGRGVDQNINAYVDKGSATLRYFSQLGLGFQLVRNLPDTYFGMAPGAKAEGRMVEIAPYSGLKLGDWRDKMHASPYGERRATDGQRAGNDVLVLGEGIIAAFVRALLDRGERITLEAPARRLIVDDRGVTGLLVEIGGREVAVRTRFGVVLASGSYESNARLVRNYEDLPFREQVPQALTGDGLIMAAEIGAMVHAVPRQLALFLGYEVPVPGGKPTFWSAGSRELPFPHSIVVNRAGRRFGDESFYQKLLNALRDFDVATHTYPNLPAFLIVSQQFVEQYSFAGAAPGAAPSFVARGDTPEGLAAQLGIEPSGLRAEIERFNRFAKNGRDDDFGRGEVAWSRYHGDPTYETPNLGPLEPPFFGVELQATGGSSAGLLTNVRAQVIDQRGNAIRGLYASGDCAASIDFGIGYQAGLSLGRNLIFGLAAVRHMLAGTSQERLV